MSAELFYTVIFLSCAILCCGLSSPPYTALRQFTVLNTHYLKLLISAFPQTTMKKKLD